MIHHPNADIILEGLQIGDDGYPVTPVNLAATVDDNVKGKKKPSKSKEATQQIITWVQSLNTSHIVLTQDGNTVQSIGGKEWSELPSDAMKAFIKTNKISMPNDKRRKNLLGECVANHMKAGKYKNNLTDANRKKSSAITKPACITEDGTLYRICNTIIEKKDDFIATKDSHDKGDQDTRKAKSLHWENMALHYHSDTSSLDKLSPAGSVALIGHSIPSNVCTIYDILEADEFEGGVAYILAHYREARNKRTKSGNHHPFSDYIGGKKWLLYFHSVLEELGDRALTSCAYPLLVDEIMRTSDSVFKPLGKGKRRAASPRVMSGSPVSGMSSISIRNQKQSAIEATEAAATSIESKNMEQRYCNGFDRMMKLKETHDKLDSKYHDLKKKRKMCMRKEELHAINRKLQSMKKQRRAYESEIERIKQSIEYDSPDVSDVSDDTDSDDGGKKGGDDSGTEEFEDAMD